MDNANEDVHESITQNNDSNEKESETTALVQNESKENVDDAEKTAGNAEEITKKQETSCLGSCSKGTSRKLGSCCSSLKSRFSSLCCGFLEKKETGANNASNEDDNASMTSREVNDFIEDELKKLSTDSIPVEKN